jgi:sterol desaturase/sphingolipid hydroxylase (fatty acid hydroxylase superfamily)
MTDLAQAFLPQGPFLKPLLVVASMYGIRYLVLAGIAFLVWYARRPEGKLQRAMPQWSQIRREIGYSALAVLVFGLVDGVLFGYGILRHMRMYWDIAQYGWAYFWLSIPLMIVMHDAYFYWTHRLMHTRALFRAFHGVHHLSRNPTPWTTYSFHPLESVVAALGIVLILFVLPMHPLALLIFHTISTAINVYGHLGYELYPRGWAQHPLGRWINTSVAHNAHHAQARHNFGFYFLFWDRWMGTLDPAYEAKYRGAFAAGLRS